MGRRGVVGLCAVLAGCGLDVTGTLAGGSAVDAPGDGGGAASAEAGAVFGADASNGTTAADAHFDGPTGTVVPSISWTVTPDPPDVDLTLQGALDWAHWGDNADASPVRKATGGALLGTFTLTGSSCDDNFGPAWPVKAAWSDGMPQASSSQNILHRRLYGRDGLTVSLSAPCDGSVRVLSVDVGGWSSEARFEADFDTIRVAPPIQDTRGNTTGYYAARYVLTYVCPVASHVVVRWVATNLPASVVCAGSDLILSSATLR